ncbi:hypothetical protein MKEN_01413900 [Mycena kentingensis (nom. inval.)]|nr:hypothetical protein MKEN_01413900 [Mycena kentingensis (nom. inval.)]
MSAARNSPARVRVADRNASPKKNYTYETKLNLAVFNIRQRLGNEPFSSTALFIEVDGVAKELETTNGPRRDVIVLRLVRGMIMRGLLIENDDETFSFTDAGHKKMRSVQAMERQFEGKMDRVQVANVFLQSPQKQTKKSLQGAAEILTTVNEKLTEENERLTDENAQQATTIQELRDEGKAKIFHGYTPHDTLTIPATPDSPARRICKSQSLPAYEFGSPRLYRTPQSLERNMRQPLAPIAEFPPTPTPRDVPLADEDDVMEIDENVFGQMPSSDDVDMDEPLPSLDLSAGSADTELLKEIAEYRQQLPDILTQLAEAKDSLNVSNSLLRDREDDVNRLVDEQESLECQRALQVRRNDDLEQRLAEVTCQLAGERQARANAELLVEERNARLVEVQAMFSTLQSMIFGNVAGQMEDIKQVLSI